MNRRKVKKFTADFETSTPEWYKIDGFARVWAFAICEIGNTNNFIYGNSIDDFMKICSKKGNYTYLFHNLKFDGQYIIDWLFRNGFTHIRDSKEKQDKTFTTLINDMGQFYNIEVYFHVNGKNINKVTFEDSLKLLNLANFLMIYIQKQIVIIIKNKFKRFLKDYMIMDIFTKKKNHKLFARTVINSCKIEKLR